MWILVARSLSTTKSRMQVPVAVFQTPKVGSRLAATDAKTGKSICRNPQWPVRIFRKTRMCSFSDYEKQIVRVGVCSARARVSIRVAAARSPGKMNHVAIQRRAAGDPQLWCNRFYKRHRSLRGNLPDDTALGSCRSLKELTHQPYQPSSLKTDRPID
jgi:hypothetical protein